MVELTIPQINRELNYLEENYNRLAIKTVQYREEKNKLLKMKAKVEGLSDNDKVKLETLKKPHKKSILSDKFRKDVSTRIEEEGLTMVDDSDNSLFG